VEPALSFYISDLMLKSAAAGIPRSPPSIPDFPRVGFAKIAPTLWRPGRNLGHPPHQGDLSQSRRAFVRLDLASRDLKFQHQYARAIRRRPIADSVNTGDSPTSNYLLYSTACRGLEKRRPLSADLQVDPQSIATNLPPSCVGWSPKGIVFAR
jgi:hypothetical protein